ncbi:MAG: ABC transporter ATP-binding protein [Anaerohalosphaera sp.]|nr:ABC transporter ATP-binding protein [Anaerohalosphaera sp.]
MLAIENVIKTYHKRMGKINAIDGVSLDIAKGSFVVLNGPSGSGKTTLLMAIASMLHPSAGSVTIDGTDIYRLSAMQRARFRAANIGFIFQMFHLIPYLSIIENVLFAAGVTKTQNARSTAKEIIAQLSLTDRMHHRPSELSAGEKQRAAIARAMLNKPRLILADEPTGNLDPHNAEIVLGHLSDYNRQGGTVIVVTHGDQAKRYATRTIQMENGRVVADTAS